MRSKSRVDSAEPAIPLVAYATPTGRPRKRCTPLVVSQKEDVAAKKQAVVHTGPVAKPWSKEKKAPPAALVTTETHKVDTSPTYQTEPVSIFVQEQTGGFVFVQCRYCISKSQQLGGYRYSWFIPCLTC